MRFLLFTMIVEHFVPLKQLIKSTLCPFLISFKVPSCWHGNQSVQTSRSDAVVDIRKWKDKSAISNWLRGIERKARHQHRTKYCCSCWLYLSAKGMRGYQLSVLRKYFNSSGGQGKDLVSSRRVLTNISDHWKEMTGIIARIGIQQGRGSLIIVIGRGAALWNLIVANIWRGSNLFLPALSLTLYSSCLPALLKPNLKQPKKINNSSLQKLKLQKE